MKALLSAGAIAVAAAALASPAGPAPAAGPSLVGPPAQIVVYGHVRSLVRVGARYELRLDPAHWLGGVTAQRAAAADGVVGPGEPVPNDYYVVDESKRALTYLVPPGARVTVVTRSPGGPRSTPITVAELAQIVKGRNPRKRDLYGRTLGFWARVTTDTVRSLDQQYQP